MDLNRLTETAIRASIVAGNAIMKIYNSKDFQITSKIDNSPLTIADLESNKIITDLLTETNIPILSEEGKDIDYKIRSKWDIFWLVDPIDGTKEFIKKNGEFTVNIALIKNQSPILGVIFAPVLQTLYFSNHLIGSFKSRVKDFKHNFDFIKNNSVKLPINRKDKSCVVVASRSHMSSETEDFINSLRNKNNDVKIISKGSSLKLCLVAEGSADFYPRYAPTMEWDTGAGHAICIYAGCKVIDVKTNKEMLYNKISLLNNWFLISKK